MRITSAGLVGIGTSSPTAKLQVDGNFSLGNLSTGTANSSYKQIQFGNGVIADSGGNNSSFQLLQNAYVGSGNNNYAITSGSGTSHTNRIMMTSGVISFARAYPTTADSQITYSESMRITSAGLVGIGTSSPSTSLHISSASPQISLTETDQSNKQYRIGSFGGAYAVYDVSATQYRHIIDTNGNHIFNEGGQDCDFRVESNNNANMLFVDGGNDAVIFGDASNTNPATSSTAAHSCFKNGGSKLELSASSNPCLAVNRVNSEGTCVELRQAGGLRGSISVAGASASFNTSSDYRLKENVNYDFDATSRLKELKPARFNWISDETNTLVDGFIAHEVSSVVPEAISGEKDAVNEDGSINPQGIDQSKLVPLLVKTIQELEARITTLETTTP